MSNRRVGLWFIGAYGGVGGTAAMGLAALKRGLADTTGLTTALPMFAGADLDEPEAFVIGGHDIRQGSFSQSATELHARAGVFSEAMMAACQPELDQWTKNVRPGSILNSGETISQLADLPEAKRSESPRAAIQRFQNDLKEFREKNKLDQVVVVNVASTEPPFAVMECHSSPAKLDEALKKDAVLPTSSLYAYGAIDLGFAYVNFTPSLGAGIPALEELAHKRRVPICGKDGKTGETMMKSVLAPMFAHRNLHIMSWVGHNIFGNRDGVVLNDPANKASKVKSKDALLQQIVGYKPQTLVTIEYIESLDDWKTAWDHIHYRGFLGTKMILQFIWQGCDSLLAAPLVLDLARLSLLAQRRGESGILKHLACFFKSPMGVDDHDFFHQFAWLEEYAKKMSAV
ncbi:MAG TPA: inositol-3-phosphate synthase [Gemmataceae bacterium]|nr:inositol-3-phosphate synthase [Gemmataceae bacterium]